VDAVGDLITLPAVDTIEALDFEVGCDGPDCDRSADWIGEGTCPACGVGVFDFGTGTGTLLRVAYLCSPHRETGFARLRRFAGGRCRSCKSEFLSGQILTLLTWQRIR
jgi:hypothetical protein